MATPQQTSNSNKRDNNQKNKVVPTVDNKVSDAIETEKSNLESIESSETAAVITDDNVTTSQVPAEVIVETVVVDTPAAEVAPAVESVVVTTDVPPVVETKTTIEVPPVVETKVEEEMPHYVIFFDQYVELTTNNQLVRSTAALNNCIKSMVRVNTEKAFNDTFKLLSDGNRLQHSSYLTSASSTLSFEDRTIFETIIFCFTLIFNNTNKDFNFDGMRNILKNDLFVDWCVSK